MILTDQKLIIVKISIKIITTPKPAKVILPFLIKFLVQLAQLQGQELIYCTAATASIGTNVTSEIQLAQARSEEHTSELQSRFDLVCRLLLEKKKTACVQTHDS